LSYLHLKMGHQQKSESDFENSKFERFGFLW